MLSKLIMGIGSKLKRGIVRSLDSEAREEDALNRDLDRTKKISRLESKIAQERAKRREIIDSENPSIKGIIGSKFRESQHKTKISNIQRFNRDAVAENLKDSFSKENVQAKGKKVKSGYEKFQSGANKFYDKIGYNSEQSINIGDMFGGGNNDNRRESAGGNLFGISDADMRALAGLGGGGRSSGRKRKGRRSNNPWDLDIGF